MNEPSPSAAPVPRRISPAEQLAAMAGFVLADVHDVPQHGPSGPVAAPSAATAPAAPSGPVAAPTAVRTVLPIDVYLAALGAVALVDLDPSIAPRADERVMACQTMPDGRVVAGLATAATGTLRVITLAHNGRRWAVVNVRESRPGTAPVCESRRGGATADGGWHYGPPRGRRKR